MAEGQSGQATLVEQTAAAKIAGFQMMQMTGTQVTFIPFKGAGPAMQAMLGGQVDFMILQAAAALPQARAGAVKISRVIPDLPTADESGVPGLYATAPWSRGSPTRKYTRVSPTSASTPHPAGSRDRKWWPVIKAAHVKVE